MYSTKTPRIATNRYTLGSLRGGDYSNSMQGLGFFGGNWPPPYAVSVPYDERYWKAVNITDDTIRKYAHAVALNYMMNNAIDWKPRNQYCLARPNWIAPFATNGRAVKPSYSTAGNLKGPSYISGSDQFFFVVTEDPSYRPINRDANALAPIPWSYRDRVGSQCGDPLAWNGNEKLKALYVWQIVPLADSKPKDDGNKNGNKTATDEDCPPPENCVEKWVDKILHVSARPSNDAIEIPVAFKKLVCEGDIEEDPEVDCEELLKALQGSIAEGGVPGMMGLAETPQGYPPDWCNDCEERLVKASAYVTESPTAGSKPFKVKVKVLVCETDADPTIDCEEVLRALGAGLRAKRKSRTLKGLSESTRIIKTDVSTPQPTMPKNTDTASKQGQEFDTEANKLDPNRIQALQAGMPWWAWIMIGGAAIYAARKL